MGLERLQSIFNNIEDNVQSLEDGYPVESVSNSLYDESNDSYTLSFSNNGIGLTINFPYNYTKLNKFKIFKEE